MIPMNTSHLRGSSNFKQFLFVALLALMSMFGSGCMATSSLYRVTHGNADEVDPRLDDVFSVSRLDDQTIIILVKRLDSLRGSEKFPLLVYACTQNSSEKCVLNDAGGNHADNLTSNFLNLHKDLVHERNLELCVEEIKDCVLNKGVLYKGDLPKIGVIKDYNLSNYTMNTEKYEFLHDYQYINYLDYLHRDNRHRPSKFDLTVNLVRIDDKKIHVSRYNLPYEHNKLFRGTLRAAFMGVKYVLLPITLAFDVVTLPIQLPFADTRCILPCGK